MTRLASRLLVVALALAVPALRGDDAWARMKLGMTSDETAVALGRPLLRSSGKGFEVWTYDNGAQALFYGSLVGWTAPGTARVEDRSMDVWRSHRAGTYFPTFLALLPQPAPRNPPPPRNAVPETMGDGVKWLPTPVYRRRL